MRAPESRWHAHRGGGQPTSAVHHQTTASAPLRRDRLAPLTWAESFLPGFADVVERDAVFLANPTGVPTRRAAKNPSGPGADELDVLARESVELIDVHSLALEQIAFHLAAVSVLTHAAADRHYAMAWHDERHDVARDDIGHRPHSPRLADLLGQPGVTPHFSARNAAHGLQDLAFQLGAIADVDRRLRDAFTMDGRQHLAAQRLRNCCALQCPSESPAVFRAQ